MGYTDYMKQVNGGNILIDFNYVPDKVFIDANQVRGIYKARILSRQQKKSRPDGSGDVMITSATGGSQIITREELCKNYNHSSGKKIVLAFLKTDTSYIVQSKSNEKYKVLKLPDNCIGKVNNKSAKPGSYIVCKSDDSGIIDKSTMTIVSPNMFRKMFKIPMQSIIKRHMNGGENKMFGLFNSNRNRDIASRKNVVNPVINMNTESLNKNNVKPININTNKSQTTYVQNKPLQNVKTQNKYKFVATHRIISMTNGKLIGFVILEKSTGESKQLNTSQVSQLCNKKLVENLMLVTKENSGVRFLKGNGIRIESLPEVIG